MIELGTDSDDRVYVRWAPGGPWTVLDRDGRVTTEPHALRATIVGENEIQADEPASDEYNEGYEDGYREAIDDARTAVADCDVPMRRRRKAAA